jgi:hypothetical protein
LILKKYFALLIPDLFSFLQKGFLNSQAVRIRVKVKIEKLKLKGVGGHEFCEFLLLFIFTLFSLLPMSHKKNTQN